ncbi:GPI ethanolamine phosphate transferase 2-like isoform X3 [Oncorhynchus nerka]|uniref:GPI ethanolamine phosphate transferase 2-like isoform X3 n=1 Tax=Oncorhynchus nerka TaxID=8023 RepID=UPI0031B8AD08
MRVRSSVFASFCLILEVLSVALFLRGFFPVPVKSSFSSKSKLSDLPAEPFTGSSPNLSKVPDPLFKRVVIVLIDALREDFVFGPNGRKYMPYTRHLVERGSTHSFVAKARPPTVTMPRIKALTTGSIPGFIDVVMNLNSPALLEDNLIWQAKTAGKRMVFYGDDTWVKLFPKHFMEYDGTTSFFVSDYTEVDNNVTRHLDSTLKRDDWDILILHYLGLDHIGHISGPHSSLIQPKLMEMDDILKKIHGSLILKETEGALPYLLVLCGDHGMSETGSHGGSSAHEVNTPLVLISPAFKRKVGMEKPPTVEQVDLTPTLALGLGLPISQNSVGRLIQPVVEEASLRDQLRFLHLNGHQLSCLLKDSMPAYEKEEGYEQFRVAEKSHGNWLKLVVEGNTSEVLNNMGKKVLKQYLEALRVMSAALSKQMGKYDMYSMVVGVVLVFQFLLLLLLAMPEALSGASEVDLPVSSALLSLPFYLLCLLLFSVHMLVCTSAESACYFCSLPWGLVFGAVALSSALLCILVSMAARKGAKPPGKSPSRASGGGWSLSELDILLLAGTAGHTLSLSASSFVEEEHQVWYFLLNTLCLVVFQDVCRKYFREHSANIGVIGCSEDEDCLPPSKEGDAVASPLTDLGVTGADSERWLALATPLLTLACCRLLRSLNQTGVQWVHLPDLGHWLNRFWHYIQPALQPQTTCNHTSSGSPHPASSPAGLSEGAERSISLRTQDGAVLVGRHVIGSYLLPGPAAMFLGLQDCPGPRPSGCLQLPGGCGQRCVTMATLRWKHVQGDDEGTLRVRLHPGHLLHGLQGPAEVPGHHSRRPTEEQGIVGNLQWCGSVGGPVVPGTQPAGAMLLPAGPVPDGPVHLEEAPLRRCPDHHHALLVRTGLLLLPGELQQHSHCGHLGWLCGTGELRRSSGCLPHRPQHIRRAPALGFPPHLLPQLRKQELSGGRPWLLLLGPAALRAGGSLRGTGHGSALPPLHLERLLAQAAV